jgi:hypothetical protein
LADLFAVEKNPCKSGATEFMHPTPLTALFAAPGSSTFSRSPFRQQTLLPGATNGQSRLRGEPLVRSAVLLGP